MTHRLVTGPAVEPVSVAEAVYSARISSTSQEPAPGAITVALASPAAPGQVDNGVHRYLATFVTADGETQAGIVSSPVTVADKTVNGKVQLSAIPTGGALVTARKIYRTTAGGSTYLLLATIADNTTTTYLDNLADSVLGAGAPSTNTTLDPEIGELITAAREMIEGLTGRKLITQTWEQVLDSFPTNELKIDMLPIQSIVSVTYIDENGDAQVMDSGDYVLDAHTLPGWLLPAHEVNWPTTLNVANAVVVRFVAGYGNTGADVPAKMRRYIKAQVKAWFDGTDDDDALGGLLDEFDIMARA